VNDQSLAVFTDDLPRRSPGEVVHLPERDEGKDEGEEWNGEDVNQHPTDVFELAVEDVNDDLKTVDRSEHDEGKGRNGLAFSFDEVDELRQEQS